MKKTALIIGAIIIALIGGYWFLGVKESAPQDPETIAREWIVNNSPTYNFDGYDLALVSERETGDGMGSQFVFEFNSSNRGWGDRTEESLVMIVTPHRMVVEVINGEVVSAVTDGVFSEIDRDFIRNDVDSIGSVIVNVYFVRNGEMFSARRSVSDDRPAPVAALEEIIKGVDQSESDDGLSSKINPNTRIISFVMEGTVAIVDLSAEMKEGLTSADALLAYRQIEETIIQFPIIEEVIVLIEGEEDDIFL